MSSNISAEPAASDSGRTDDQVFEDGARALGEFLKARPQAADELIELIGRRFNDPIDQSTWGKVETALRDYFANADAGNVLAWALNADEGDRYRVDELAHAGGLEVGDLARRITGAHGIELRDAYAIQDFPDNWRSLSHSVYQALSGNGRVFISLTVVKQNWDRFVLDGPADSMMSFAAFVLDALRRATPKAFSEEGVEDFIAELEDMAREWRKDVGEAAPTTNGAPE